MAVLEPGTDEAVQRAEPRSRCSSPLGRGPACDRSIDFRFDPASPRGTGSRSGEPQSILPLTRGIVHPPRFHTGAGTSPQGLRGTGHPAADHDEVPTADPRSPAEAPMGTGKPRIAVSWRGRHRHSIRGDDPASPRPVSSVREPATPGGPEGSGGGISAVPRLGFGLSGRHRLPGGTWRRGCRC